MNFYNTFHKIVEICFSFFLQVFRSIDQILVARTLPGLVLACSCSKLAYERGRALDRESTAVPIVDGTCRNAGAGPSVRRTRPAQKWSQAPGTCTLAAGYCYFLLQTFTFYLVYLFFAHFLLQTRMRHALFHSLAVRAGAGPIRCLFL